MKSVSTCVLALGVLSGIALCGCSNPEPPAGGDRCGDAVCKAGEVCDAVTKLCVAEVAPKVTIDTPQASTRLTGDSAEITGTVVDDAGKLVHTEASVQGGEWVDVKVGDDGKFTATVPLPKLDAKSAKLRVRAFDALNQEGVADVDV
ncbi:MAG: hypothetical protein IRZ16_04155 [Myxococcaceae bacterium]|nr:hypothetical protein [Myxococcaceae bacterium]